MRPELIAFKRATGEMIRGVGGLEAAAGFCRVGKSVLGDNQSINKLDSFVALDVVADLEPLARDRGGWPHVTTELCRANGGMFVALPDPGCVAADIHRCAADHAKESSEITARIFQAVSRGKLTPAIVAEHDLLREAREAAEAAMRLLTTIEAVAEAG
jgi:hypothetical protein